jgi:hypothetical protein
LSDLGSSVVGFQIFRRWISDLPSSDLGFSVVGFWIFHRWISDFPSSDLRFQILDLPSSDLGFDGSEESLVNFLEESNGVFARQNIFHRIVEFGQLEKVDNIN